jgi:hypothetical protein
VIVNVTNHVDNKKKKKKKDEKTSKKYNEALGPVLDHPCLVESLLSLSLLLMLAGRHSCNNASFGR